MQDTMRATLAAAKGEPVRAHPNVPPGQQPAQHREASTLEPATASEPAAEEGQQTPQEDVDMTAADGGNGGTAEAAPAESADVSAAASAAVDKAPQSPRKEHGGEHDSVMGDGPAELEVDDDQPS